MTFINLSILAVVLETTSVSDALFSHLSPASLTRVGMTCQAARLAVASYMHRVFDINKHLSRFFPNPVAFRSLQARTGSLISGSNALQFLDRTTYKKSDLDLYVPQRHVQAVADYLLEIGYEYRPRPNQIRDSQGSSQSNGSDPSSPYLHRGVTDILDFLNPHISKEGPLEMQVIVTRSPVECVLNFHSTCVMNIISFKAAYSLYPRATFEERCSLVCTQDISRRNIAFTKYGLRGWTIFTRLTDYANADGGSESAFPLHTRRVGDRLTWRLPLDMTGVEVPQLPGTFTIRDSIIGESWLLGYTPGPNIRYRGLTREKHRHLHGPRATVRAFQPQSSRAQLNGLKASSALRLSAPAFLPKSTDPVELQCHGLRASAPTFEPGRLSPTSLSPSCATRHDDDYSEVLKTISAESDSDVSSDSEERVQPSSEELVQFPSQKPIPSSLSMFGKFFLSLGGLSTLFGAMKIFRNT